MIAFSIATNGCFGMEWALGSYLSLGSTHLNCVRFTLDLLGQRILSHIRSRGRLCSISIVVKHYHLKRLASVGDFVGK